ncbi:MAG: phytanoyl-CoA dioxygenase family protein [Gammaproteobacteria bacterium]|nr:phytanoyl-CoA dioxygenase family protein [Gammaproteobacteria bacterium]
MEIGDWRATPVVGPVYKRIRELGLERNVAELDAFGFTILPPGKAAPVEFTDRMRGRLLEVAEHRTGVKHDVESGEHGQVNTQPHFNHQYILYYLLLEDKVFQQAATNPYLLALQTYMLGMDCVLSSVTAFVKWRDETGYGETLGLHADTTVKHPIAIGHETHTANSAWVLTDYTEDNGAIAFVPGSHQHSRHPKPGEGVADAIPVEAPAGSLLVWHGNLWHGAFPRKNEGLRLVVTYYFNRSYLQVQEDYRHTVTPEILSDNPKRLAVLLGLGHPWGFQNSNGPDFSSANRVLHEAYEEAGIHNVVIPTPGDFK